MAKRIFELFLVTGEEILHHLLIKILVVREQEILDNQEIEVILNFICLVNF